MFEERKLRYLTRGVNAAIPFALQVFLWECIDRMPEERDYLQVFHLSHMDGMQRIEHTAEQPVFRMEHLLAAVSDIVTAKVYVIDDGEHCTMLLAEEY
ncbi:MAG: DUF960 domain-containing protein [Oscillospiraceae bacterium]|nr:DUF960 domain-containing protein [Oscillospiraceae bacterium]